MEANPGFANSLRLRLRAADEESPDLGADAEMALLAAAVSDAATVTETAKEFISGSELETTNCVGRLPAAAAGESSQLGFLPTLVPPLGVQPARSVQHAFPRLQLEYQPDNCRIEIFGSGVNGELLQDLSAWLSKYDTQDN